MLSAAAILMITMGVRQTAGLFVAPLDAASGLGIVSISFALAIGQFVWGLVQPIFGAIADKRGSFSVLVFGALSPVVSSMLAVHSDNFCLPRWFRRSSALSVGLPHCSRCSD